MVNTKNLDDLGIKILTTLQHNARISFSELGRIVGLSSPAVADRVKKMEDAGLIKGYKAVLNPEKIGFNITAIISISSKTPIGNLLDNDILELPEAVEIYRISGDYSFQIKVITNSLEHLETIVGKLNKYGETTSSIILSSPVESRSIPVHFL
jgi:Lrp/AsnC family leucine-responsive transcriptional regulator